MKGRARARWLRDHERAAVLSGPRSTRGEGMAPARRCGAAARRGPVGRCGATAARRHSGRCRRSSGYCGTARTHELGVPMGADEVPGGQHRGTAGLARAEGARGRRRGAAELGTRRHADRRSSRHGRLWQGKRRALVVRVRGTVRARHGVQRLSGSGKRRGKERCRAQARAAASAIVSREKGKADGGKINRARERGTGRDSIAWPSAARLSEHARAHGPVGEGLGDIATMLGFTARTANLI